jgi:DNA-binding XRE family transcriptional regulator
MTATYLNDRTASTAVSFYDFVQRRPVASVEFATRIRSVSPAVTSAVEIRRLPEPVDGTYSFHDLYSLLDAAGRSEFEREEGRIDAELSDRFNRKEISPLFYYRCVVGMTQEELAARAGSRQSFLSQVEKRKRPLTWKQARKFAAVLGVQAASLMEEV